MSRRKRKNGNGTTVSVKQAEPTGSCWCGCGTEANPWRFFAPYGGHDSNARRYLKWLHRKAMKHVRLTDFQGHYPNDATANLVRSFGYDPKDKTLYGAMLEAGLEDEL